MCNILTRHCQECVGIIKLIGCHCIGAAVMLWNFLSNFNATLKMVLLQCCINEVLPMQRNLSNLKRFVPIQPGETRN